MTEGRVKGGTHPKILEDLQAGQKALAAGQEQQGKLLNGIAATMASVLEEQQAQRIDIRSLHTELHETREELKGEIRAARAEAKMNNAGFSDA